MVLIYSTTILYYKRNQRHLIVYRFNFRTFVRTQKYTTINLDGEAASLVYSPTPLHPTTHNSNAIFLYVSPTHLETNFCYLPFHLIFPTQGHISLSFYFGECLLTLKATPIIDCKIVHQDLFLFPSFVADFFNCIMRLFGTNTCSYDSKVHQSTWHWEDTYPSVSHSISATDLFHCVGT